ncbi:hypothetical protein ACTUSR_16040 [Pantoea stewartii subsp. indologenes]|uniref:hypothetical protein n=1 Tax=Pantoea stewartii TaxID=66269 RepID=UPI003FA4D11E
MERVVHVATVNDVTPSDWRCPTGIVLMGESSHPFLPWPDYRQGKSRQMSHSINALIKHAQEESEKKAG